MGVSDDAFSHVVSRDASTRYVSQIGENGSGVFFLARPFDPCLFARSPFLAPRNVHVANARRQCTRLRSSAPDKRVISPRNFVTLSLLVDQPIKRRQVESHARTLVRNRRLPRCTRTSYVVPMDSSWTKSTGEVLKELNVPSECGLSEEEVTRRREKHGWNGKKKRERGDLSQRHVHN